jgi:hypothetical protein
MQAKARLHKEMLSRIEVLESLMTELPNATIPEEDLTAVTEAIARLKALPVGGISIGDWIRARADGQRLKEIASKTGGDGPVVHIPYWLAVWYVALTRLAQSVSDRLWA